MSALQGWKMIPVFPTWRVRASCAEPADSRHQPDGTVGCSPEGRTGVGGTMNVVVAEELRKRYGETVAVDGVSLAVERGEVFGIIGPNGSGKTTTVECLQGLRRPDGGELRVLGLDPVRQGV